MGRTLRPSSPESSFADFAAGVTEELEGAVFELCVLAHLGGVRPNGDPRVAMQQAKATVVTRELVRDRLRKTFAAFEDADAQAARIFLDLARRS